jgi:hypothetical protein
MRRILLLALPALVAGCETPPGAANKLAVSWTLHYGPYPIAEDGTPGATTDLPEVACEQAGATDVEVSFGLADHSFDPQVRTVPCEEGGFTFEGVNPNLYEVQLTAKSDSGRVHFYERVAELQTPRASGSCRACRPPRIPRPPSPSRRRWRSSPATTSPRRWTT